MIHHPTEFELRVAKAIYDADGIGVLSGADWNNLNRDHREVMLRRARAAIAEVHKFSSFYRTNTQLPSPPEGP